MRRILLIIKTPIAEFYSWFNQEHMTLDVSALPVVVGITGASGSILALTLIKTLLSHGVSVELVTTEKSLPVILQEEGLKIVGANAIQKRDAILGFMIERMGLPSVEPSLLRVFGNQELDAPPSSGTHLTRGMVVIPCSMGTLGKIAHGIGDNLVCRAADVTIKEARKLILVPREAPLSALHLENLLKLARLGVIQLPPMLTFYLPQYLTMDGQINVTVGKTLDHLGIGHNLYQRWGAHA